MLRRRFEHLLVFTVLIASVLMNTAPVFAGTTGGINGRVVDEVNGPVAGAIVTAASASQSATAKTDATGAFSFISLAPDTYTVSVTKQGFDSATQSGVTVQADQTRGVSLTAHHTLREIGHVTARSASDYVKPGVTADVYSITPAQQQAAASLGGGTEIDSAYSSIASVPGTFIPIGGGGWGQSILIRGGDYTQTGNEVDGVPVNRAFDQYASTFLSSLGNQEVQVYTGAAPADAQANGLAGYVNQVIKVGSYPGFGDVNVGLGTPAFYHKLGFEGGTATLNHNFSIYAAVAGYDSDTRILDQFNGRSATQVFGQPYNYDAVNCGRTAGNPVHPTVGCYTNGGTAQVTGGIPLGPNGYNLANTFWDLEPTSFDREGLVNMHIGIPHRHDGNKDDIQLLYNTGEIYAPDNGSQNSFGTTLNDITSGSATLSGGSVVPGLPAGTVIPNYGPSGPSCGSTTAPLPVQQTCQGPISWNYSGYTKYSGPLGGALTSANLAQVQNVNFPGAPSFNGPIDPNQRDMETNGYAIEKLQFQHNFSSSAFVRLYGYSLYSDRIDNGAIDLALPFIGGTSTDYVISAHTRGYALNFADQLNAKHLLSFDVAYTTSNTSRFRNDTETGVGTAPVAYLVSSANPTAGCYGAAGAVPCAKAYEFVVNGPGSTSLVPGPNNADPGNTAATIASETPATCGGAPCEYLAVNSGLEGARNTVQPIFVNGAIQDLFHVTDRLTVQLGLRYENFLYNMQNTVTPGNVLLVNDYNATHCISGVTITPRAIGASCGTASATQLVASSPSLDYNLWSPRVGATYEINPNNVLRASYGRFTQPAETSSVQATNVQSGPPSADFYRIYGFSGYSRSVQPEISYNTDFSWEHSSRDGQTSFTVSPFYRKTQNEFVSILIDPKTNFIANINGANRTVQGFELGLRRGNFSRDGFAAQLAYTYTWATEKFAVSSTGGSLVTGANAAITQYNAYTKTCAGANAPAGLCGATASGQPAAPCYTTAGLADNGCAAGSVANPYWNSPVYPTLDPNASYIPFNQSLGLGSSGSASSYFVPHVAALILNYRKGPFAVTPSLQFEAGSRYGSPLASQGPAPDACGTPLAGAVVAGDPRYPYGALGGSPYDAVSCSQAIGIPDPFTKNFDGLGTFVQPNLLDANIQLSYDVSKKVTVRLTAANVMTRCFGGSNVPWNVGNIGCGYAQAAPWVGTFYNPGDSIQNGFQYPYVPFTSGSQQSINAESPLPFQLFLSASVKL